MKAQELLWHHFIEQHDAPPKEIVQDFGGTWDQPGKFFNAYYVISIASLSEEELSHYCREKGLYPEQVRRWKEESLQGFQRSAERKKQLHKKTGRSETDQEA